VPLVVVLVCGLPLLVALAIRVLLMVAMLSLLMIQLEGILAASYDIYDGATVEDAYDDVDEGEVVVTIVDDDNDTWMKSYSYISTYTIQ
jgi:hypothetical protein